jgi:hypothetical protein
MTLLKREQIKNKLNNRNRYYKSQINKNEVHNTNYNGKA